MEDTYHVAYLSRNQQASLRGLLFQYLKGSFPDIAINVMANGPVSKIDIKTTGKQIGDALWDQFKVYNGIVKKLVSFDDLIDQKGTSKTFSFRPEEMDMILKSIVVYRKNDNGPLTDYQRNLLSKDMDLLEKLFIESSKYQYTKEEIRLATREAK